jgi:hypothetical protein
LDLDLLDVFLLNPQEEDDVQADDIVEEEPYAPGNYLNSLLFSLFWSILSCSTVCTDLDLNLPLDEFGAIDMDFIQNMAGICFNSCYIQNLPLFTMLMFILYFVEQEPVVVNHRWKQITDDMRKQVYQALLARSNNGKLHKKDTQIVAEQFNLHVWLVCRVWSRGKIQLANSVPVVVASLKRGELVVKQLRLI